MQTIRYRTAMAVAMLLAGWQLASAQTVVPNLPAQDLDYVDYAITSLPAHFQEPVLNDANNTPVDNPLTNAGATLGRVLFYDKQLSHDFSVACSTCHTQPTGFGDTRRKSEGVNGQTARHSMALGNSVYYENGKMFWDERADSLEDQALQPIQDPVEMNLDLNTLVARLQGTPYYAELFNNAFGTPDITTDRIAKAIAQFERAMVSYQSPYDAIFNGGTFPDLAQLDTDQLRGWQIFHSGEGRCGTCHISNAQIADAARNIGLDETDTDDGAGDGKFKSPSLRNVAVRGRFMHDGRFSTLEEVVEFYATGVNQSNPNLDPALVDFIPDWDQADKDGLVAFLEMLTDNVFLTSELFANPFVFSCDFDGNGDCSIDDINAMLAEGPLSSGVAADADERFDLNFDGTVDMDDVEIWLEEAALVDGLGSPYKFGDANLDGVVDGQDFILWNGAKFTGSLQWNDGDFNGDGVVDGQDFIIWNSTKFTASDLASVPEPATLSMLLAAFLVLAAKARRI